MTQESQQEPDRARPPIPPTPPRPSNRPPARTRNSAQPTKGAIGGKRPPLTTPPAPKRTPPKRTRTTQGGAPPPETRTIMLNGVAVPYTLRVSARARRLRFVIRPTTGLEVVTPRGISPSRIEEGLRAKAQWILTTGARMAQQTQPTLAPLTTGRILPYLGRRLLLIVHTGAPAGRFRATMTALTPTADATYETPAQPTPAQPTPSAPRRPIAARGLTQGRLDFGSQAQADAPATRAAPPNAIADAGAEADGALTLTVASADEATVRAALEAWYRRQAQAIVAERLALWNQRYGFTYHRVTIKEQKTRWGSCSRQGNLNFNWRLLLAPLDILDYVLIHELSHLKEQNHSARFWAVVALACPEYRARRHWLREHGHELRF